MDVFEAQRFLVENRLGAGPGVLPGGGVGEVVVLAQSLPVLRLMLDPEVAAAGLLAVEGVAAQEPGRIHLVDGRASVDAVAEEIWSIVSRYV